MREDHESTKVEAAAYLAREADAYDDRYEDARLEEMEDRSLPRATRRCADCGVALWSVCVCEAERLGYEPEELDA